jgi:hypothetical protein
VTIERQRLDLPLQQIETAAHGEFWPGVAILCRAHGTSAPIRRCQDIDQPSASRDERDARDRDSGQRP